MREAVWKFGKWKTKALRDFVEEENPDVYFVPIYPVVYMAKIQLYILKKYPKPYVCYLADDNYSYKSCGKNIFAYIHRFFLRRVVKKLAKNCNQMFTITKTEAEDTDRLFGTKSVVLTKGIDYSTINYASKPISKPVRMVYTGNLVIGRASSLVAISKAMANINKETERVTLDIYSPTMLDEKTMSYLNSNGCHFRGQVKKQEVAKIQEQADVVVFVESLEKKHRLTARLSFSTKLTDYFRSGKCIFAIGDKRIAPIIYLTENDSAIICTDYTEIEGQLQRLIDNNELIIEYGKKAFDCGKVNHNEVKIKEIFVKTFMDAVNPNGEKVNG
jgi:glycosyltransferase involved in cell wall biosynthesis